MVPLSVKKKVIAEANIVEIVSEYVKLQKKGNNHFGLCPFHDDKNPSMSVSNKVKMFNCFSCGCKGNVIQFVSKIENIDESMATIKIAKKLGINIDFKLDKRAENERRLHEVMKEASSFYHFYLNNSEEGLVAKKYLHDRGITDQIIETFNIGLSPSINNGLNTYLNNKGISELDQIELGLIRNNESGTLYDIFRDRIIFPLNSSSGQFVGFSGRIYKESNQAKYLNSNDNIIFHKGEVLYNYHNAANISRIKDRIYLFEGFMDVIAAHRAGIFNGVATMGTALTKQHINLLLNVTKNIVLCFDGDDAGIHAMKRSASMLAEYGVIPESVVLPNGMDPDEYIKANGGAMLESYLITKARSVYENLYELAYKKLIKEDVSSVEKFKNEVFEFINFSKSKTIVDFYLNKMVKDLGVTYEFLANDFGGRKFIETNPQAKKQPVIKQPVVKIPLKVISAYQIIIKHIIYNPKRLAYYKEEIPYPFIDKALSLEASIIVCLEDIILNNPTFETLKYPQEKILPLLLKNESFNIYLDKLEKNTLINPKSEIEFNECLKTLKVFIRRLDTIRFKNRALLGEVDAIDGFVENKKNELI